MSYALHRAKLGEAKRMPDILRVLAERLRAGTLDSAEVEFLATAFEQIAAARNPAEEAKRALCLVGPRGGRGHTRASAIDLEISRAFRVRDLVDQGAKVTDALEQVADEGGLKDVSDVRRAYYKYKAVLWLGHADRG